MTSSELIDRLVQIRHERRTHGTDITQAEHDLVDLITRTRPQADELTRKEKTRV